MNESSPKKKSLVLGVLLLGFSTPPHTHTAWVSELRVGGVAYVSPCTPPGHEAAIITGDLY